MPLRQVAGVCLSARPISGSNLVRPGSCDPGRTLQLTTASIPRVPADGARVRRARSWRRARPRFLPGGAGGGSGRRSLARGDGVGRSGRTLASARRAAVRPKALPAARGGAFERQPFLDPRWRLPVHLARRRRLFAAPKLRFSGSGGEAVGKQWGSSGGRGRRSGGAWAANRASGDSSLKASVPTFGPADRIRDSHIATRR
jgi:hypothetical protein